MTLLSIDPATPDTGGLLYRGIKLTSEAKVTDKFDNFFTYIDYI